MGCFLPWKSAVSVRMSVLKFRSLDYNSFEDSPSGDIGINDFEDQHSNEDTDENQDPIEFVEERQEKYIWDVMSEKFSSLKEKGDLKFRHFNQVAVKRLQKCNTANSLISFLASIGSKSAKSSLGRKIHSQQSRRKPVVLAGEKKSRHQLKTKRQRTKRPRNLSYWVAENVPAAKGH